MKPSRAALALLATTSVALANGRAPATSTIHFQRGAEQNIVAGMTFGLLLSRDGGSSWTWMCEAAVGYGGTYDPSYSYTRAGTLFATTFNGLAAMRDGCSFRLERNMECSSPTRCRFVAADTTDAVGDFFCAASDPHDARIYRSTDDGSSFPHVASPGQNNDWWESLVVAADPKLVYLTGYRLSNAAPKQFLLFVSRDGGASFEPMAGGAAVTTRSSTVVDIASVDPDDANAVYLTVKDDAPQHHYVYTLWRSIDAGSSFAQVLSSRDSPISAVARRNHELVAATQVDGVRVSHDRGSSWSPPLPGAPHVNCLTENSAGEVWACTLDYGTQQLPSDGAGIMKTTDLAHWVKVLRYQDIVGPVACGSGTTQQDTCTRKEWCTLAQQLQITATPVDCPPPPPVPSVAPPTTTSPSAATPKPAGGCCDGSGGGGVLALAAVVLATLLRTPVSSGRRA